VGNRYEAYTTVACSIAKFEEYRAAIVDHIWRVKLFHWDVQVRTLSSKALHDLVALDTEHYLQTTVLQTLIPECLSDDLYVRHGAILGVAEIILGLGKSKRVLIRDKCTTESIVGLVPTIEKARLYRGRGGEIMRSAVCRLIECISIACIPLTVKQQVSLDS